MASMHEMFFDESGHTFKGWSESSTATSATYLPGSTYTFPTGVLRKTFYAVWN